MVKIIKNSEIREELSITKLLFARREARLKSPSCLRKQQIILRL
jgi:hypothetical protein